MGDFSRKSRSLRKDFDCRGTKDKAENGSRKSISYRFVCDHVVLDFATIEFNFQIHVHFGEKMLNMGHIANEGEPLNF